MQDKSSLYGFFTIPRLQECQQNRRRHGHDILSTVLRVQRQGIAPQGVARNSGQCVQKDEAHMPCNSGPFAIQKGHCCQSSTFGLDASKGSYARQRRHICITLRTMQTFQNAPATTKRHKETAQTMLEGIGRGNPFCKNPLPIHKNKDAPTRIDASPPYRRIAP